jgi:hypothetical protein
MDARPIAFAVNEALRRFVPRAASCEGEVFIARGATE